MKVDICYWFGISCNSGGSIDSILLGANNLVGTTHRSIFYLENLEWLWLYSNPIQFSFHGIGEAKSLTSLLLDSTGLKSLEGIGVAYQLIDLDVSFNSLSGPISDELTKLANLESISLSDNDLTGAVPRRRATLGNDNPKRSLSHKINFIRYTMRYESLFTNVAFMTTNSSLVQSDGGRGLCY